MCHRQRENYLPQWHYRDAMWIHGMWCVVVGSVSSSRIQGTPWTVNREPSGKKRLLVEHVCWDRSGYRLQLAIDHWPLTIDNIQQRTQPISGHSHCWQNYWTLPATSSAVPAKEGRCSIAASPHFSHLVRLCRSAWVSILYHRGDIHQRFFEQWQTPAVSKMQSWMSHVLR